MAVRQERETTRAFAREVLLSVIELGGPPTEFAARLEGASNTLDLIASELRITQEDGMDEADVLNEIFVKINGLLSVQNNSREALKALVRTALELGGKKPQDLTTTEKMELDRVARDHNLVPSNFEVGKL